MKSSPSDGSSEFTKFFKAWDSKERDPKEISFLLNGQKVHLTIPETNKYLDTPDEDASCVTGSKVCNLKFSFIARGTSKELYLFGDDVCFLPIWMTSENWERVIKEETEVSDEVTTLGLKAQNYTVATLSINDSKDPDLYYSIPVLKAKSFFTLAEEQNITIIDTKGTCYGKPISFYNKNKDNLKNLEWHKKMLQSLMDEFALGLSYNAPCLDSDSRNFYVSHPSDPQAPPTLHLFLYDLGKAVTPLTLPVLRSVPEWPSEVMLINYVLQAYFDILCIGISREETLAMDFEYKSLASFNRIVAYLKDFLPPHYESFKQMANEALEKVRNNLSEAQKDKLILANEEKIKAISSEYIAEGTVESWLKECKSKNLDREKVTQDLTLSIENHKKDLLQSLDWKKPFSEFDARCRLIDYAREILPSIVERNSGPDKKDIGEGKEKASSDVPVSPIVDAYKQHCSKQTQPPIVARNPATIFPEKQMPSMRNRN